MSEMVENDKSNSDECCLLVEANLIAPETKLSVGRLEHISSMLNLADRELLEDKTFDLAT